ncbi:hypothetical protein [Kitasatospora mediocidica]|uniref:hypothetical protein n=1 Tax=Kitasatospora mediocidica TaxID=58352 RepID=UPI0005605648|nr:hypothetical protein [Kitasatospora mediocidica]
MASRIDFSKADDGRYHATHEGTSYELEKRRKNPCDGCPDTGWYLYGGPHFGTWCASTIAAAIAEANNEILAKPPVIEDGEGLGCADCARPNDGTWPIGSDICNHCWDLAEAEDV